jgi:hypothetical protein
MNFLIVNILFSVIYINKTTYTLHMPGTKKNNQDKNIVNLVRGAVVFTIFFLFAFIFKGVEALFFILFFIGLNIVVTMYKRVVYAPIEIETLSFGIILCSAKFGLIPGLTVAIIGGIIYVVYNNSFSPFTLPMMLGYIIMAVISSLYNTVNITLLGIAANLAHNIFVFSIYYFVFRYDVGKNILYSSSNLIFNILLFSNLGPLVFRLM